MDSVEELSPGLRLVTFTGEPLSGTPWTPGCAVGIRVGRRVTRHYTVAEVAGGGSRLGIVFQLHRGDGPGTRWARSLAAGDRVALLGPRRLSRCRRGLAYFLVGDASAVGLFQSLAESVPASAEVCGVIEVPAEDLDGASLLVPGVTVVASAGRPGEALLARLREERVPVGAVAHLAGHVRTVRRARRYLRGRRGPGLPRAEVVTRAFWTGR
ncbi:hypothetical protein GCM10010174_38990 [Kutzneria viridogrisea]